jgi:hypothetical protein
MCISIVNKYEQNFDGFESSAVVAENYGGYLRGHKGAFLEELTKDFVTLAFKESGVSGKLSIDSKKRVINDSNDDFYKFSIDVQVFVNDNLIFTVECKNYCDISMFKRVVYDSVVAQKFLNAKKTYLIQFEDSMNCKGEVPFLNNSSTTNFCLNVMNNDNLKIITLLPGQRNSNRPINKKEFRKSLDISVVRKVCDEFIKTFKEYV